MPTNFTGKWKLRDSHLFEDFMADCSEYRDLYVLVVSGESSKTRGIKLIGLEMSRV